MVDVLVQLSVEDYAKWKQVFDEVSNLRKSSGSKGGQLFRKQESNNQVAILFEWDDLAKAKQYFGSDVLRQAMQRAGIQGKPDINYLTPVEKLSA
jgi:heme-degrading monooxygenase HmoA